MLTSKMIHDYSSLVKYSASRARVGTSHPDVPMILSKITFDRPVNENNVRNEHISINVKIMRFGF
jgi:hypothetical protein